MGDDHEGCGRHTINSSALADSTGRGQPTTERQVQAPAADRVLSERPAPAPILLTGSGYHLVIALSRDGTSLENRISHRPFRHPGAAGIFFPSHRVGIREKEPTKPPPPPALFLDKRLPVRGQLTSAMTRASKRAALSGVAVDRVVPYQRILGLTYFCSAYPMAAPRKIMTTSRPSSHSPHSDTAFISPCFFHSCRSSVRKDGEKKYKPPTIADSTNPPNMRMSMRPNEMSGVGDMAPNVP